MKNIFLSLVLFIFGSWSAVGQVTRYDQIVKNDSTVIEAKIIVVTPQTVNYIKSNYLDGPEFQLSKNQIAYIKYANGEIEHFKHEVAQPNNFPIYYAMEPWTQASFTNDLTPWRDSDLKSAKIFYEQKVKNFKILGSIFTFTGTAAVITSIAKVVKRRKEYRSYGYTHNYNSFEDPEIIGLFIGGIASTLAVDIIALSKIKRYNKYKADVISEIERRKLAFHNLKFEPSFQPFTKTASLRIVFNF